MKPGKTSIPAALMVRAAGREAKEPGSPMAAMVPSLMARSPGKDAAEVWRVPPEIRRSNMPLW